jgi:tetratricopeptide (TPR) repeat protein
MRELRHAIRLDPAMTEARVTLAQTLARAGRMAEAHEQQAEVRRINAEAADYGRALVLLQTAADRMERGEVTRAIDDLREAAGLSPRFAETHHQLGLALARSGAHAEDAAASFRRAIELDPGGAAAHYELGLLLAKRDRAGASSELRAALAAEPGLADAHRALARIASDEGNWPAAISELQKVVIWSPRSADAHFDLAAALAAKGDAAGAARETTVGRRLQQAPRPPR